MAKFQRVEDHIELKCHAHKFFDIWACKPHLVPKISPKKVTNVELHEGDWGKVGVVINWSYVFHDRTLSLKTKVEEVDVKNGIMKYSYPYHDELILKDYYKTLRSKVHVTPKGEGCIVKWCFEYEKLNEDTPSPKVYVDYLLHLAKDIDAYLSSAY